MTDNKPNMSDALAAFQNSLPDVKLDATNPHFKSKFASLANMTREVFPKLSEHGLSFSVGSFVENGVMILDAHLLHVSGESRSMQIPTTENNPQKLGSFISYMRRYALAALTGVVADEDDDGNAASTPTVAERQLDRARSTGTSNRPAPAKGSPKDTIRLEWIEKGKISKEEVNEKFKALQASGTKGDEAWAAILADLEA